jgi:hypothetical protein
MKLGLLKLKGEHRLRVLDNRVLRISDVRREDKQDSGEDTARIFTICTFMKCYSGDQ